MGDKARDIKVILSEAMAKDKAGERAAYLDAACGDNAQLRGEIESLLQLEGKVGDFLEAPVLGPSILLDEPPVAEGPGTVIGRYKLLERIGEGGMAVVYMAEQAQPIRRKVALKIIKLGMDTRQVIARFEAERQALALMDHPSIAKVLDAGATETGRPYFVMELVTGVSITEYCDKNNLSTKDRLALFVQVCNAVQHAHQKGIIHRDIKPSNVMVTHHDGKPVPKVIDFGIAKATNQKLTEKTLFTRYAHIIGTPAYMSPEQAELSDLDIDTRTDIYSLGVLLYELLTGTTPFSEEELRKAGYIEMQRIIREQEPLKPSTRLRAARRGTGILPVSIRGILPLRSMGVPPMTSDHGQSQPPTRSGDARTTHGRDGRATHGRDAHATDVRGDLDWIVMKTLEKDRARRYETASGLAEDIRRHLASEPVLARGPSTPYLLRKFLRRHRVQTLVALTVAILVAVVAVLLSIWNQDRLQWERDRLQLAEADALRHQALLSQAQGQYAGGERDAALETIQPILDSPHVGGKARLLEAGILVDNRRFDEATTILKTLLDGPGEIAGAAHVLMVRVLREHGDLDAERLKEIEDYRQKAQTLLPETAEAYFMQAMGAMTIKEQLAALNGALGLDPEHYESLCLRAFTHYASRKYDRMLEDALDMTYLRRHDSLGHSLRAVALRELGNYGQAIAAYDRALRLMGRDDPQSLALSIQRCETFLRMGDYPRVIAEAKACSALWPDRPDFDYHGFCALTALGEYEKAQVLFRAIVERTPTARNEFWSWATKYVFDTLAAGRSWHPPDHTPAGAAFLPLVEAEETYHGLSSKAHRVVTNGFSAQWSPDGRKLAFSLGVHGYSGIALYDPATRETELLIVPGKDPRWSPDGRYIAFVRDCQALRLEELTATERKDQMRWEKDEEVWVMNADGTEPRRLASGGWPSWGKNSAHVYFQSRLDDTLCSVSITGPDAEPKRIMACASLFPSVSPDNQRVAYREGASLKIKDLASQTVVAQWPVPFNTWGGPAWLPTGKEVCWGAGSNVGDRTGLWVYSLDSNEPVKVLTSQIMAASWAPEGTKFVFALRPPYFELWTADLDPALTTVKALGPGQTLAEHWQDMLRLYARRIGADPQDASPYSDRARYYDYLHDRAMANADMRRWSAAMRGRSPSDVSFGAGCALRRVLKLPLGYELVFSAERLVKETPILNVAFGQKGKCEMKLCEIPLVVTSLLGFCFLCGLEAPPAHGGFVFGTPTNLGPTVNTSAHDDSPTMPADGLSMFFSSTRLGGIPVYDLFVVTRETLEDEWSAPVNLGPPVNAPGVDINPSISADGLTLVFGSNRPGGSGGISDIWITTRETKDAPWADPVNLGPLVNSPYDEWTQGISADALELYFGSNRPGGAGGDDLWVTMRATTQSAWGAPVNLGPTVNSPYADLEPVISADGLCLMFWSVRPGGYGSRDIWITTRASRNDPWRTPINPGPPLNSPQQDQPHCLSPDGSVLYFSSNRDGGYGALDIWQAPILPIVDFNADGKVDLDDLRLLIDNWGTDDPLYDIGPFAWGDGKVDIEDLKVFVAEWEKQIATASEPAQP